MAKKRKPKTQSADDVQIELTIDASVVQALGIAPYTGPFPFIPEKDPDIPGVYDAEPSFGFRHTGTIRGQLDPVLVAMNEAVKATLFGASKEEFVNLFRAALDLRETIRRGDVKEIAALSFEVGTMVERLRAKRADPLVKSQRAWRKKSKENATARTEKKLSNADKIRAKFSELTAQGVSPQAAKNRIIKAGWKSCGRSTVLKVLKGVEPSTT